MSWLNPSQDEAADEYYSSKSRYNNAANQRNAALKSANKCRAEKTQAINAKNACIKNKVNFERRIEDIKAIIGAISGVPCEGMMLSGINVPNTIISFNNVASETDNSYKESMKCSGITATSILDTFKSMSIDEDYNISTALQMFRAELERLKQAVRELQIQMNSLTATIDSLNSKINAYNAEASSFRKVMVTSAFEMNHFKGFM